MGNFFEFVELRTKITSLFAFAITMALLIYNDVSIQIYQSAIFFTSMFIFDLTTTAINNYIDTKTNGQPLQYSRTTAKRIIFTMLGIATALGLYLVYLTDIIVLMAGALCFFCGIVYTYGPVAISRIPLGEILSGVFYGFFIPFIVVYINVPQGEIISYGMEGAILNLGMNLKYIFAIVIVAITPTLTTSNIMLANNTSDLVKDIKVNRFTLVYYIGKKRALSLYKWLYIGAFVGILLTVLFGIAPITSIGAIILGLPFAMKNVNVFKLRQIKSETFVTSIKNYILINGLFLLSIIAGIFIKKITIIG